MVQEDCVSKLAEMQNSYHTLVGISMELVSALESAIAGRPVRWCTVKSVYCGHPISRSPSIII